MQIVLFVIARLCEAISLAIVVEIASFLAMRVRAGLAIRSAVARKKHRFVFLYPQSGALKSSGVPPLLNSIEQLLCNFFGLDEVGFGSGGWHGVSEIIILIILHLIIFRH